MDDQSCKQNPSIINLDDFRKTPIRDEYENDMKVISNTLYLLKDPQQPNPIQDTRIYLDNITSILDQEDLPPMLRDIWLSCYRELENANGASSHNVGMYFSVVFQVYEKYKRWMMCSGRKDIL